LTNHRPDSASLAEAEHFQWQVKNWRELLDFFQADSLPDPPELAASWIDYVKQVCNMVDCRRVSFDPISLYSRVSFNALIDELIDSSDHVGFLYKRYTTTRAANPSRSGSYYSLTA